MSTRRDAPLATVSVVMMPCAASTQPSALNARCAAGKPAAITCTGNGSPITPVETGRTSWLRTPASAATPSQQVIALRIPCSLLPALALPVLIGGGRGGAAAGGAGAARAGAARGAL